ncbi:MAG: hypothetical protein VYA17_01645 [Pseudomonadota bacterium]|nr:hypothetical protein [Pseudomonadota bacterium]
MAIKKILAPVGDIAYDESAIGTALCFGSHADCVFIRVDRVEVLPAKAIDSTVASTNLKYFMKSPEWSDDSYKMEI